MSPQAGRTLVSQILPLITAAIARGAVSDPSVPEDRQELIQDALALAARFIENAEAKGKPIIPGSFAYYALQQLKSGRRSTNISGVDAMSSGAHIQRGVSMESLDAPFEEGENDTTLHDVLAGPGDDPAARACRKLDWEELLENSANDKRRKLVRSIAEGFTGKETAGQLNLSAPRIVQLKKELASDIKYEWGEGIIDEIVRKPSWRHGIVAARERRACRHEMKTA